MSFSGDACLSTLEASGALKENTASLVEETLKNDDLQMTIRAVREVAVIATEVRKMLA